MFSMEYKVLKADGEEMGYGAFLNTYLDNLENPTYEYWVLEEGGAIRGLASSHMS